MELRPKLQLIAATQIVSIAMTIAIMVMGWSMDLSESQVQSIGGTLTTLLIVLGAISHFQARRDQFYGGLVAAIGVVPPVFAYVGGSLRQVITYHVVVAIFHGLIVWSLVLRGRAAAQETPPSGDGD